MQEFKFLTTASVIFDYPLKKVALIRRPPDKAFPNALALPGGKVKEHEDFRGATIRETIEETGFQPIDMSFSGLYQSAGYLMVCYYCRANKETDTRNLAWYTIEDLPNHNLAPNVKRACEDAYQKAYLAYNSVKLLDLDRVLDSAVGFIQKNHFVIGGQVGWDHFLQNKRIGIIGTAIGIMALCYNTTSSTEDLLQKSSQTLIDKRNTDGAWTTRSLAGPSIVESTYYCLLALSLQKKQEYDTVIENGIKWIRSIQNLDGGWGSMQGKQSRVLTTTFCIELLTKIKPGIAQPQALNWLLSAQNEDGSWGQKHADKKGTTAHTARGILCLLQLNIPTNHSAIIKANKWLIQTYGKRGVWENNCTESEYIELGVEDQQKRIRFTHAVPPLVLQALLSTGEAINSSTIFSLLIDIIEEGKEKKYWTHPLDSNIPIWNSLEHIKLLHTIKANYSQTLYQLIQAQLHEEQTKLVDSISLVHKTLANSKNAFVKEKSLDETDANLPHNDYSKQQIRDSVKKHLQKNEIELAIEQLMDYFSENKNKKAESELIRYSGSLHYFNAQHRTGKLTVSQFGMEINNILNGLIYLVENEL